MAEQCPPITRQEIEAGLRSDFDNWFKVLQTLTENVLVPEDWTERWFDGYTPAEALKDGPDNHY